MPDLGAAASAARHLASLLRKEDTGELATMLEEMAGTPLARLAEGLKRDAAAVQNALRQQLRENTGSGSIWVTIERDIDALLCRFFNGNQRRLVLRPVRCADGLQVRDLEAAVGVPRKPDLLFDGFHEVRQVTSHMRRVDLSVLRNHGTAPAVHRSEHSTQEHT